MKVYWILRLEDNSSRSAAPRGQCVGERTDAATIRYNLPSSSSVNVHCTAPRKITFRKITRVQVSFVVGDWKFNLGICVGTSNCSTGRRHLCELPVSTYALIRVPATTISSGCNERGLGVYERLFYRLRHVSVFSLDDFQEIGSRIRVFC